jgi:glycosyltransferase involved in cell wall biosynthesis
LLDAAERLYVRGVRDFSLVFIGSPPAGQEHHLDDLRRRVSASPIAARVVITGFMSDVSGAMRALDVVCVPSTEAEAFGLVATEAMAASRPVLAADIGGLAEVVGEDGAGWLHPPGNAEVLADQMLRLLEDDAQRERMGRAGHQRYREHFTVSAMTAGVLDGPGYEGSGSKP